MTAVGGEMDTRRRECSNVTLAFTIGYVRDHGGAEAVDRLLEAAGERRSLAELEDDRRWSTYESKIRLFEAAALVLRDPDVGRHIGETVLAHTTGATVRLLLRAVGSPGALCRSISKAGAKFATTYTTEAVSVGRTEAVIEHRLHPGYEPNRYDCDYTYGLMSVIPSVFGLPKAVVVHDECQVLGAPACVYRLRWPRRYRLPWRARLARRNDVAEQLRLLQDRHDALQSTVVDLVSPADVDTVLARITRRAADAVRAQEFVLAIYGEDDRASVHHEGMDRDAAYRLAEEILVDQPDDHAGSRLIVDVASARRSYGRLAALYPPGQTFFPEERRLLATYARHAAVALDAATSLQEVKQRGDTAEALLDLGRALAQAATSGEVAERLAVAVPALIGGYPSSVLLVEAETGDLVVRGRGGPMDDARRRRQLRVRAEDTPAVAEILEQRVPQHRDLTNTDPFLRALLEQAGAVEMIVVPIVGDVAVFGTLVVHRLPDSPPFSDRRALVDRLNGVAVQAGLAFEKVRLLEQERAAVERLQRDERRISHIAYHDALTGLPNRLMFSDALDRSITSAREVGASVAVLFCDLDRFKNVNDSLGHARGDELLRMAAGRLVRAVRAEDTLARLGGDEFTVLLTVLRDPSEADRAAERMLEALRTPFVLAGQEIFVTASIGVATFPADGLDAQTVLKNADTAMYAAKRTGPNAYRRYRADMNAQTRKLLALEADLHHAIVNDALTLQYQPEIDPISGSIVTVEALARWPHPVHGLLLPSTFIPLAEETGLILAFDEWVLRTACAQLRAWDDRGAPPVRLAVNLSAHQLRRPAVVDLVREVLQQTGIAPFRLELELTESVALHEPAAVRAILRELRAVGVGLALDDFGTGYSALRHLKDLPVDRLKIDRTFVAGLPSDRYDRAIVTATIAMAHGVGLEVTAEGVETEAQAAFLIAHGCDLLQGFLYARPEAAPALEARLSATVGV
ncbi:MAG: hypothetical protein NVSMB12_10570 [Acidimicrobiales bacterium]